MGKGENEFVAWLAGRYPREDAGGGVLLGIGDDMAVLRAGGPDVLVTTDMLMDGVDFDARIHTSGQIGRKALAVSLSDCAAMAVRPRWALVSVALPSAWSMDQAKGLYLGMEALAKQHECRIVGGDTNSWGEGLVIEVTVVAEPWPGVTPVRRSGMRPGDLVCVTGRLGGTRAERHLTFEPRVRQAALLAAKLRDGLHAMLDISDGLSTDSHRLAEASLCGMELDEAAIGLVVSDAALDASRVDGRTPLEHALHDGEDFELLYAVDPRGLTALPGVAAQRVGEQSTLEKPDLTYTVIGTAIAEAGVWLRGPAGRSPLKAGGWQHFVE